MLDQQELSSKTKKGISWVFVERILVQGILFIRIPLLALLLAPEDYGLMGLILPVLAFLDVITRTGFSTALVQKKGNVADYWHSGWSMNFLKSIVQTSLLLLLIKPIADFYEQPILIPMLLVISTAVFVENLSSIRVNELIRSIDMRKITIYTVVTNTLSTIVTIALAYYLRNVWALVIGYVITIYLETIGSYIIAPYRPRFEFDRKKMSTLWSFSKWVLLSGVLLTLFRNGDDIFVGKVLGITAIGYYTMAYKMGNMITTELADSIRRVLFPTFSLLQDDIPRLRASFLTSYALTAALGFLFSLGLLLLAPQFVRLFLEDKWLPIIPPLRILAIWGGFQMVSTSIAPLLNATGRPDRWAKLQGFKLGVMALTIYPLTMKWGITGTAVSVLLAATLEIPIDIYWIKNTLLCQWRDAIKPIVIPIITAVIVALLYFVTEGYLKLSDLWHFLIFGTAITLLYISMLLLFDLMAHVGYFNIVKRMIPAR